MTAPSSPVPAVEACPECPDMGYGVYSERCPHCPIKAQIDSVTEPTSAAEEESLLGKMERLLLLPEWPNEKAWVEAVETAHALVSTPTPGRAAEPDPTPKASVTASEAGRVDLLGGWYFQQLNPPHGVIYALRTPKGRGFGINGTGMSVGRPIVDAFAASLTPSGQDAVGTMAEVERLAEAAYETWASVVSATRLAPGSKGYDNEVDNREADHNRAHRKLLSAVRTIVTRAEIAEAQLTTLRAMARDVVDTHARSPSSPMAFDKALDILRTLLSTSGADR